MSGHFFACSHCVSESDTARPPTIGHLARGSQEERVRLGHGTVPPGGVGQRVAKLQLATSNLRARVRLGHDIAVSQKPIISQLNVPERVIPAGMTVASSHRMIAYEASVTGSSRILKSSQTAESSTGVRCLRHLSHHPHPSNPHAKPARPFPASPRLVLPTRRCAPTSKSSASLSLGSGDILPRAHSGQPPGSGNHAHYCMGIQYVYAQLYAYTVFTYAGAPSP